MRNHTLKEDNLEKEGIENGVLQKRVLKIASKKLKSK